jgi:hypothetical protein
VFSSRDLLGSGYTETYSVANGSEVTEKLHGQVWNQTALPRLAESWQQTCDPSLAPSAGPLPLPGPCGGAPGLGS